jgi:hypothetical protein
MMESRECNRGSITSSGGKPVATQQVPDLEEEFARRGDEIYERQIRDKVEHGNKGKIVAVDVETGAYELAEDELAASDRLLSRYPDAQIWFVRVGCPAVHRMGSHSVDGGTVTIEALP